MDQYEQLDADRKRYISLASCEGLRNHPPWADAGPALRVGYDPRADEFIIRAPGGHIVGATKSLEEVGRLIKHESFYGYGSTELLLQGRHPDDTYTYHGLGARAASSPRRAPAKQKEGKLKLTLADLGLDF